MKGLIIIKMKQNYQIILNKTITEIQKASTRPSLLLHACCAPCSSYVLEYLNEYFDITVFFYNPNITEKDEYTKREIEIRRLISELPHSNEIKYIEGKYDPESFFNMSKGLEHLNEGGERCFKCYRLRLSEAAKAASDGKFAYFTTTLSISPHKNAEVLNSIGKELAEAFGINYLYSDFKKKNGYKRSCELSVIYGLYRQDYCGCVFSKAEAIRRNQQQQS